MRNRIPLCLLLWVLLTGATDRVAAEEAKKHILKAAPGTVHWGYYDASLAPVITIQSGDFVEIETVLIGAEFMQAIGMPKETIHQVMRDIDAHVKDKGPGPHLLVGPIAIEGAEPGDVLEVRILDIEVADDYAVNLFRPGGGTLPEHFPYQVARLIPLDRHRNVARFRSGVEIPLRPFFGSMGVAPPWALGRISSTPPGYHAGNLDNKELIAGTTLYIPIHVKGALFSIGDGHAGQGDGEVDGTAIEAALRGKLRFILRKDVKLTWPRAESPEYIITMGFHPDLDEAAKIATWEMVNYLVTEHHLTREEAYMLTSIAVDLRVTQLVDDTKGIHAMLPKKIFVGN